MTRQEHTELFKKCLELPDVEKDSMINSGVFNEAIEGYLILTLKELWERRRKRLKRQEPP